MDRRAEHKSATYTSSDEWRNLSDVTMAYLVQQNLPRTEIPAFDGAPTKWVNFITKFRDVVHNQKFLTDTQRCIHLVQRLEGPAERSVSRFTHDARGYVLSLKRLKFMFGQKTRIAQATLREVTTGEIVQNSDRDGLSDFYYSVSDCLVTLRLLNYVSDLYSSDTLRLASRRLPGYLVPKWAEVSVSIRGRGEEPNLIHFENWLQRRVLIQQEIEPRDEKSSKASGKKDSTLHEKQKSILSTQTDSRACPTCDEKHLFWKCKKFDSLQPEERFNTVVKMKRCLNCFCEGHAVSKCPSKNTCRISPCKERHHTTLHEYYATLAAKAAEADPSAQPPGNAVVISHSVSRTKRVFLQIVPVMLYSAQGKTFLTYGLLDNGCDATLVRKDIARRLRIRGQPDKIIMNTVKDNPEEVKVEKVTFDISARDGSNRFTAEDAYVVPKSKFHMPSRPRLVPCEDDDFYTNLDGIDLDAVSPDQIGILIGGDNPRACVSDDVRSGKKGQPLAVHTLFGWTLFGGASKSSHITVNRMSVQRIPEGFGHSLQCMWSEKKSTSVNVNTVSIDSDELLMGLEKFFQIEQEPIAYKEPAMSQQDVKALKVLEKETKIISGRYQAPMLWKEPSVQLPNNRPLALKRFSMLLKRLKGDQALFDRYKSVIDSWVQKGYARKLTPREARTIGPRTWTLPTHPVESPNKPGKTRVVSDAAAKFQGVSLNDQLLTGPDLLNRGDGVMLRFRKEATAFCCDVEEMFLRILTTEEDSDSLRFYWKYDIHSDRPPDTYKMLVHPFGKKDSPTVANYVLKRIARDHFKQFDALTYETVIRAFYVDDCLKSVASESVAIKLALQLIEMLKLGDMRLNKFVSNSKVVLNALPPDHVSANATFDLDTEKLERALGVKWNTLQDVFTFSSSLKSAPISKRGILSVSFSIFDPLGFVSPFIVIPKLLLQELWLQGRDWDEEVDENIKIQWQQWLEGCKKLSSIQIDRCYLKEAEPATEIQLHNFCDASESAYGVVSYLRFSFKSGRHATSFVMSKSKVAPTSAVTLNRLELNSGLAACRLFCLLIVELDMPIERVFFWTDATLVLQYINNKYHRFKTYVANRVSEILRCTKPEQWRHVSGSINPADIVSRGVSDPTKLLETNKAGTSWFYGTAFLPLDEDQWPETKITDLDIHDDEIKKQSVFVCLNFTEQVEKSLFDVYRFSSWPRLKRVAAWFLRFVHNARTKLEERCYDSLLNCEELRVAELFVIKDVQRISFAKELQIIRTNDSLPKSSPLASLSPFIDSYGILRVGGRLKNAPISEESKHPSILPNNNPVTKIIISHEHVTNGHIGPEHTLSNLRISYWIISGRTVIKNVLRNCFLCRIRRAIRMYPYMADLPNCRVAYEEPPFSNCGIDMFGPIIIKQGRKRLKRWGVIMTCLTIRCIHLEVVELADTDSFINSFRRFTNRRGCPKTIYSDCGSNFQGATNELDEFISCLDKYKITRSAADLNIMWEFNPPASPHMGGAWERLIRSVKEVMHGIMQDRILTDPQLSTLFTEVENIVNSRPLTHISDDINDLRALTPNHVLLGLHRNWGYVADTSTNDVNSRKKWRQVQAARQCFWSQWKKQYLPTLTKRSKWKTNTHNVKVGELVILDDDSSKRRHWPLARVTKATPSKDGVVRVVEVRTKEGTYTRPVTKLLRLEDDIEVPQGEGDVDDSN